MKLRAELELRKKLNPIKYYEPLPQQEQFHKSNAVVRLILGGNRSGKTEALVVECIWFALGTHPYFSISTPSKGWVVTPDFTNTGEKIKEKFRKYLPKGSYSENKKLHRFALKNGSIIQLKSIEQDITKFGSEDLDYVAFDERFPQVIFDETIMRLVDRGGKIWIAMTELDDVSWVEDRMLSNVNQRVAIFNCKTEDNKYLSKEGLQLAKDLLRDDVERGRRLEGTIMPRGGYVVSGLDWNDVIIPSYTPSEEANIAVGIDTGRDTAAVWVEKCPDGIFKIYRRLQWRDRGVGEISDEIKNICKMYNELPTFVIDQRSQLKKEYTLRNIPVIDGESLVKVMRDRVTALLKDGKVKITEDCMDLIKNWRKYRYKHWHTQRMELEHDDREIVVKKDDHDIDAAMNAIYYLDSLDFIPSTGIIQHKKDKTPHELIVEQLEETGRIFKPMDELLESQLEEDIE